MLYFVPVKNHVILLMLVFSCFFQSTGHAACPPTATELPGLSVSGNQIKAGNTPIRLRGVAVADRILVNMNLAEKRTAKDYTFIKSKKANVVRISVHPVLWLYPKTYGFKDRDALVDALANEVQAALCSQLYVILDWHVIGWPVPDANGQYWWANQNDADAPNAQLACPLDPPSGSPQCWELSQHAYDSTFDLAAGLPTAPTGEGFWRRIARDARFQDNRIVYELWNEPVSANEANSSDVEGSSPL